MIAYLHKNPAKSTFKFTLTICDAPCSGEDFTNSRKVHVQTKAQARQFCRQHRFTPFNF